MVVVAAVLTVVFFAVLSLDATPIGNNEAMVIAGTDIECNASDPGAYPVSILDEYGNIVGVRWMCPHTLIIITTTTTTTTKPPTPTTTHPATTTTSTTVGLLPLDDGDGDGIPDDVELLIGSDPTNGDTDGDGESDGVEVGDEFAAVMPVFVDELGGFNRDLVLDTDGDSKPDVVESDIDDVDDDGIVDELDPDDNTAQTTTSPITTSTTTTSSNPIDDVEAVAVASGGKGDSSEDGPDRDGGAGLLPIAAFGGVVVGGMGGVIWLLTKTRRRDDVDPVS